MRGGRFLSCRHGAIGVVHLVVVHGPGHGIIHGVDFSGIVCLCSRVVERFPRKEKKNSKDFFLSSLVKTWRCTFFFFTRMISKIFFIILGEKKAHARPGVRFFSRLLHTQPQKTLRSHRYSCPNSE